MTEKIAKVQFKAFRVFDQFFCLGVPICYRVAFDIKDNHLTSAWVPTFYSQKHNFEVSFILTNHTLMEFKLFKCVIWSHSKVQELGKLHYRVNLWTCGICGKSFYREPYLDMHMAKSHHDHIKNVSTIT